MTTCTCLSNCKAADWNYCPKHANTAFCMSLRVIEVKTVKTWSILPSSKSPPEPSHQPKPCLCRLCCHRPLCYLQVAWGWLVQSLRLCHSRQDFGPAAPHFSGRRCSSSSPVGCFIQWLRVETDSFPQPQDAPRYSTQITKWQVPNMLWMLLKKKKEKGGDQKSPREVGESKARRKKV